MPSDGFLLKIFNTKQDLHSREEQMISSEYNSILQKSSQWRLRCHCVSKLQTDTALVSHFVWTKQHGDKPDKFQLLFHQKLGLGGGLRCNRIRTGCMSGCD